MSKDILLKVPALGSTSVVRMLWDEAPETCKAVWDALPLVQPVFHGRRSGKEVFILTDPLPVPEAENSTAVGHTGDVFFLRLPPTWSDDHQDFNRSDKGVFDMAFIYGEDALLRGPNEVLSGNLFGRIVEGLEEFSSACEEIWLHGTQDLAMERIEG